MKNRAKELSKIVPMIFFAIGMATITSTALPVATSNAIKMPSPASDIAGYKSWARVNRAPVLGDAAAMLDCAAPTALRKPRGPHKDKYINVYVNEIGKAAMTMERFPKFPPGSMIVKEKLATADATAPELLTAMIKRAAGYNAAGGDWEYMVLSGDAKSIQAQGKLETCMACHAAKRDSGFVFRDYLRGEDWAKMK